MNQSTTISSLSLVSKLLSLLRRIKWALTLFKHNDTIIYLIIHFTQYIEQTTSILCKHNDTIIYLIIHLNIPLSPNSLQQLESQINPILPCNDFSINNSILIQFSLFSL